MPAKGYDRAFIDRALAVISANNGSLKAASRELGISRSTLRAWRDGQVPAASRYSDPSSASDGRRAAASKYADELRGVRGLYLDQLRRPEVVQDTKAKDAATVVGILDDKAVRAEGGPTSITETHVFRYVEPDALRNLAERVVRGGVVRTIEVTSTTGSHSRSADGAEAIPQLPAGPEGVARDPRLS
jgi:transposase-like protein